MNNSLIQVKCLIEFDLPERNEDIDMLKLRLIYLMKLSLPMKLKRFENEMLKKYSIMLGVVANNSPVESSQ